MADTPTTIIVNVQADISRFMATMLPLAVPAKDRKETPVWWQMYRERPYQRLAVQRDGFTEELRRLGFAHYSDPVLRSPTEYLLTTVAD